MANSKPAAPAAWEHTTVTLSLGGEPDYAALGAAGWQLVAVYPAPYPPSLNGDPDGGRAFVFKREVVA